MDYQDEQQPLSGFGGGGGEQALELTEEVVEQTAPRHVFVRPRLDRPDEPAPTSPLNAILDRIDDAEKRLSAANERLTGTSGRLGTSNPSASGIAQDIDRSANPGFIGTANDRIDDLIQAIEYTASLAEVFSNAV